MPNDFVGLADYSGHFEELGDEAAFGERGNPQFARQDMVRDLNKALATNGGVGADGSTLIPQSLETTLQVLSYKMEMLKLWQVIGKKPAYNTIEQFDYLKEYGSDELGFIQEGGLPPEDDSVYGQDFGKVKYLGSTRAVTHQMTLVRTIASVQPIIDREDKNGTMQMLRVLETAMFFGDDRVNPFSIQGIFQQIETKAPTNIIDMRGKPITDVTLEDIDNNAADRYGTIDTVFMENRQKNNLSQSIFPDKRFIMPASGNHTNLGMTIEQFVGNNSNMKLEGHQFIRRGAPPPDTVTNKAPAIPTNLTITPRALNVGETTQLAAGTYVYTVTAVSAGGESLGATSVPTVVGANDVVDLVFDNVAGAVMYKIYRGDNAGKVLYLTRVGASVVAQTTYTDNGKWLPGTSMAFALRMDPDEGLCWKQLAPMMKLPLAQIDTRMRWTILLYGLIQIYQPLKNFVLINCGDIGVVHQAALDRPRN